MVIMDKADYMSKMSVILQDETKFQPVQQEINPVNLERTIHREIQLLYEGHLIDENTA